MLINTLRKWTSILFKLIDNFRPGDGTSPCAPRGSVTRFTWTKATVPSKKRSRLVDRPLRRAMLKSHRQPFIVSAYGANIFSRRSGDRRSLSPALFILLLGWLHAKRVCENVVCYLLPRSDALRLIPVPVNTEVNPALAVFLFRLGEGIKRPRQ